MDNPLELKLSSRSKLIIQPVTPGMNEKAPICAINWFDLKLGWLYKLYALITSKLIKNNSGELYFRGKLHSKLEGPEEEQRDNLLIVCYRSPRQFLNLIKNKLFQLIGVLRVASVKQFCFGFTENLINKNQVDHHFNKGQLYLVHHFQGNAAWLRENLPAITNSAYQYQIEIFFAGLTSAHLIKESSGRQQATDFFMDGMLIFSAADEENFAALINNDIYKIFKRQNKVNSLYLFSRTD